MELRRFAESDSSMATVPECAEQYQTGPQRRAGFFNGRLLKLPPLGPQNRGIAQTGSLFGYSL